MKLFQYIVLLFILCVGAVLRPSSIEANSKFLTDLESEYTVQSPGTAHVKKTFRITNSVSTEYITKYAIIIESEHIQDIVVSDQKGRIPTTVNKVNNTTTVGIEFSDKIVGKGQTREFSIEYNQSDLGSVTRQTADVFIPPVQNPESINNYTVTIRIPSSYGELVKVRPELFTTEASSSAFTSLHFSNQGKTDGITTLFGKQQSYHFSLVYKLKSTASNQSIIQLPLPPDTTYQRIQFDILEPQPTSITKDDDGNWIATYENTAQQYSSIKIEGTATIFTQPQRVDIPPTAHHTQADTFWPTHEQALSQLAKKHPTVKDISSYLRQNFRYNYQRLTQDRTRIGPLTTLAQPTNLLAQDFSDFFVSLARINHIPSRTVIGFATTHNAHTHPVGVGQSDFHSWAEYYSQDTQEWVATDPTWLLTTGGRDITEIPSLHRIVLAYQGVSSTQPLPAGLDTEGVLAMESFIVSEASAPAAVPFDISVRIQPKLVAFLGLGDPHEIQIQNKTNRAWHGLPIDVEHQGSLSLSLDTTTVPDLLPYQTVSIPFTITSGNLFQSTIGALVVTIGENESSHEVTVGSLLQQLIRNPFILGAIGITLFSILLCGIILYARHRNRKARSKKK